MKKLLLAILFAVAGSVVFAVESYISFNVSFPQQWEWAKEDGIEQNSFMTSVGFSFDGLFLFSEKMGGFVSMDVFFPQKLKTSALGQTLEVGRDEYDSLWGYDVFFGVAFAPVKASRFVFAISPGFNLTLLNSGTKYSKTMSYLMGLGIVGEFDFKLTNWLYIRAACDIVYDFYGFTILNTAYTSKSDFGSSNNLAIRPKIGIGFIF